MKVACFVSLFPSNCECVQIYGAGRVAYHLCRGLAERGHNIQVFVPFSKDLVEEHGNVIVHFYKSVFKIGIMNISWRLFYDPLNYDADIVHIHNDTPISMIAGLRYVNKKGKPLVVTWHGDWIENYGSVIRRIGVYLSNRYLVDKVLSKTKIIITPSKYYVKESRFLRKYKEKLIEIPNGIDLETFNISYSKNECRRILGLDATEKVVLYLSALYPLKGPEILLKAIPEIVKEHKDTIFVFVGGGDVNRYREMSEKMGVQKYVRFTGYIEERLKPLYYKAADVFVLPSIETFESFGIVNLEAMACGTPIIASKIGGIPDVIKNGENGLLVSPKNHEALANAIVYLLKNEAMRSKMSENGREFVKSYTWNRIAEAYEMVYRKVIE
jgi:glycosyltransferase involved in cell wall biosynthesis